MSATSCQLLVIGAGPAGMAAAQTAARHGVEVIVVDDQARPGGQIYRNVDASPLADSALLGKDYLDGRQLVLRFRQAPLEYLANSSLWYLDRHGDAGIVSEGVHRRIHAEQVVIACGAQERPMPFPGWDLPGVMTAGAAQILLKSAAMVPREPPVLAGQGPLLWLLAWQYLGLGITPRAIVDTTQARQRWPALRCLPRALGAPEYLFKGVQMLSAIRRAKIPWYRAAEDLRAEGDGRLQLLRFTCAGRTLRLDTDTLLLHQGVIPSLHVAAAAGCESHWNDAQQCWQAQLDDWGESSQAGIFVAGDAAGIGGARVAQMSGQIAALQVAHRCGKIDTARRDLLARPLRNARERHLAIRPFLDTRYRVAETVLPRDETLACRCEEVTVADLRALAAQGCSGPNQAKAFSRCGMGPCQGRFCGATMERVFALETGAEPQRVGRFNARPPVKPVTLGQLAGGDVTEQIT